MGGAVVAVGGGAVVVVGGGAVVVVISEVTGLEAVVVVTST
jgi:hypothetical protein